MLWNSGINNGRARNRTTPLYAAVGGLRDGTLVRVLPHHTLQNMNIYALYPSRKFIDAKTRTWVDFQRTHLPEVIARDKTLPAG